MDTTITPAKIALPLDRLSDLPRVPEIRRKVRFQDCDPFGHLNNSSYLDYFVNAREDQVAEHYHLDFYHWSRENGTGWVFARHDILYRKPAMFNETIRLRSRLIAFGEKFVKVEATMLDEAGTALKAVMWSDIVHVDLKTQRTAVHTPELMQLFAAVNTPVEEISLDQRVRTIEEELRVTV